GGVDGEAQAQGREAGADLAVEAEGSPQVEVALRGGLDRAHLEAHRGGDHLAGELGAGGQGAEQQVARARGRSGAADAGVRLRLVDRAAQVDVAGDRRVGGAAARGQRDARLVGVGAVAVLDRLLHGTKIHAADARAPQSSSARTASTPASSVCPKSWSVSVSMRRQMPSASEKSTSATASGSARRCSAPSACLRASRLATCSRVRRKSSANSLAISSLRRDRVKSSKTTVMNSGSSST